MGIRKPKKLYLYCTYTIEPRAVGASDRIEKLLGRCDRLWKDFTGQLAKAQFVQMEQLIAASYATGFQQWEQLLSNKLGLNLRVLNDTELWELLWYRLNHSPPIEVPQVLVLTPDGLREEVRSEMSPLTLLAAEELPVTDRRWVHANGKYVVVMPFVDKPGGWSCFPGSSQVVQCPGRCLQLSLISISASGLGCPRRGISLAHLDADISHLLAAAFSQAL
jgi:hypothetical protein